MAGYGKLAHAIDKPDQYFISPKTGKQIKLKTKLDWDLDVEGANDFTSWLSLKEIELTKPVEVAECSVKEGINFKPAFDMWAQKESEFIDVFLNGKINCIACCFTFLCQILMFSFLVDCQFIS